MIGALAAAADPDLALAGLARLLQAPTEAIAGLRTALQADHPFASRLAPSRGRRALSCKTWLHTTREYGSTFEMWC
jgi:hypothetical protein